MRMHDTDSMHDYLHAAHCVPASGLAIALRQGEERQAVCRLGSYYAKLPDGGRSLFAPDEGESRRGRVTTQLESLRVRACCKGGGACVAQVYVAQGGGEEWELDGIVWKSTRRE